MARTAQEAFQHTREVAARAGLTMLSAQWAGAQAKYLFRCAQGHEFERSATHMVNGSTRCQACFLGGVARHFFEILAGKGYVCESGAYVGAAAYYDFRCGQGHVWRTRGGKIQEGSGCPTCAVAATARKNTHADGLFQLQEAARRAGGLCLADAYLGIAAHYEWQCAQGHRWRASGQHVVRGTWCRVCAARAHGSKRLAADGWARLQAAAQAHGGACLSERYVGANRRYRFRCKQGHVWVTKGDGVLRGAWCPKCAVVAMGIARRKTDGLAQLQAAAAKRGGRVLETEYAGITARYTLRCAQGHQWVTAGDHILDGSWCAPCARLERRRVTFERLRHAAKARGGACLSVNYLGMDRKLTWQCRLGHVWKAAPTAVLHSGTWCPNCAVLAMTKDRKKRLRYDVQGRG